MECVRCQSCESKSPGPEGKWYEDYTLCGNCHKLILNKEYCPVCGKVYRPEDEFTTLMVQCDSCDWWIHAQCDGITQQEYDKLSDVNATYICPLCRVRKEGHIKKKTTIVPERKKLLAVNPESPAPEKPKRARKRKYQEIAPEQPIQVESPRIERRGRR